MERSKSILGRDGLYYRIPYFDEFDDSGNQPYGDSMADELKLSAQLGPNIPLLQADTAMSRGGSDEGHYRQPPFVDMSSSFYPAGTSTKLTARDGNFNPENLQVSSSMPSFLTQSLPIDYDSIRAIYPLTSDNNFIHETIKQDLPTTNPNDLGIIAQPEDLKEITNQRSNMPTEIDRHSLPASFRSMDQRGTLKFSLPQGQKGSSNLTNAQTLALALGYGPQTPTSAADKLGKGLPLEQMTRPLIDRPFASQGLLGKSQARELTTSPFTDDSSGNHPITGRVSTMGGFNKFGRSLNEAQYNLGNTWVGDIPKVPLNLVANTIEFLGNAIGSATLPGDPGYLPYMNFMKIPYKSEASEWAELGLGFALGSKGRVTQSAKNQMANENLLMYRRTANQGPFAELPITMNLKTVKSYADKAGIGLDNIKIRIIRDPALMDGGFTGYAHPNGKMIDFYPQAFSSPENLIRTLGHERTHAYQAKIFGPPKGSADLMLNEKAAYGLEDSFVKYWRSLGGE